LRNGIECGVVNAEVHGLVVALDDVDHGLADLSPAFASGPPAVPEAVTAVHGVRGLRKLVEPRSNPRQRTMKLLARSSRRRNWPRAVRKPSICSWFHLVHVQKAVGGAFGEGAVLNVFAEHASALFFAASEEVSASVMVGFEAGFGPAGGRDRVALIPPQWLLRKPS